MIKRFIIFFICTIAGYVLDRLAGTVPSLTILGILLGFVAGFVGISRVAKRFAHG